MSDFKKIISSFKLQNELNPKFWKKTKTGDYIMKPEVRDVLLKNSLNFIEYLELDIVISDIIMIGSLCNYNWSTYSDIDIHVVVDFEQFPENLKDLYDEFFHLKKTLYNLRHDIKIHGFDLEMYVQDEKLATFSSGVFSILENKWINKPVLEKFKLDSNLIKVNSQKWMKIIDSYLENIKDESPENVKKILNKLKTKLKKYRQSGLEKGGENSTENLVFKVLRRNGYIGKILDFQTEISNKQLSLNEQTDDIEEKVKKAKNSMFLESLLKIVKKNKTYDTSYSSYDDDVVKIQKALRFLTFFKPYWDIDGKYSNNTKTAVIDFQKKYSLPPTGNLSPKDLAYLWAVMAIADFDDSDLNLPRMGLTSPGGTDNESTIMEFFLSKGLNFAQSSGIMGNLKRESGFNPTISGDQGTSYGIAQWHNERKTRLINFCNSRNKSYSDLMCQLEFLWDELSGKYFTTLFKIRAAKSPQEAAEIFAEEYEKPSSKNYDIRIQHALDIFKKYNQ